MDRWNWNQRIIEESNADFHTSKVRDDIMVRYHLYNYDYCLDDIKEMIDDNDFFENAYISYLTENEGKTNMNRDECREVLAEIIREETEL